jgi:FO synthase
MNESITRAAGSGHGQEWSPAHMEAQIEALGRRPRMRDTLYRDAAPGRKRAAFAAPANAAAGKRQRSKRLEPVEVAPFIAPQEDLLYQRVLLMAACN